MAMQKHGRSPVSTEFGVKTQWHAVDRTRIHVNFQDKRKASKELPTKGRSLGAQVPRGMSSAVFASRATWVEMFEKLWAMLRSLPRQCSDGSGSSQPSLKRTKDSS